MIFSSTAAVRFSVVEFHPDKAWPTAYTTSLGLFKAEPHRGDTSLASCVSDWLAMGPHHPSAIGAKPLVMPE
ncbi:MAG TPA: hypothetical protein VK826_04435 [Bacteroidia bacterium]|nr:hypothetical protein [Bacteroidia bacterium]